MRNKKILERCVLAIMLILASRDLMGLYLDIYLQIALLSAPLFILSKDDTLYYTFFLMTLTQGVTPYYLGVALLMITIYYWRFYSLRNIAYLLLLVILETVHCLVYSSTHIIPEFLSYFSALGLFILILSLPLNRVQSINCIKWYIYGTAFVLATMLLRSYLLSDDITQAISDRQVFDTQLDGQQHFFSDNANNVGLFSITLLSCLTLGRDKTQIPTPLWTTCLVISLVAGLFSLSRTWLLLLCLLALMRLFTQTNKELTRLALITFTAILILTNLDGGLLYSLFQNRLTGDTESLDGSRLEILISFHKIMFYDLRYVIFGVGALEYDTLFKSGSPHNMIQQIFVCYGIIGLLVFYRILSKYLRNHSAKDIPFLYHTPFIAVLVFLQSDQFLMPYHCMFPLLIAALCFNIYVRDN